MAPARRNLELKVACTCDEMTACRQAVVSASLPIVAHLVQRDTYFRVPAGRLKMRRIADEGDGAVRHSAELIAYDRPTTADSRWSDYTLDRLSPDQADAREATLRASPGILVIVTKRRDLALWGATRIHFDEVDGLGSFIELETVLTGQSEAAARREHETVIRALRLDRLPVVAGSYSDLLLDQEWRERDHLFPVT